MYPTFKEISGLFLNWELISYKYFFALGYFKRMPYICFFVTGGNAFFLNFNRNKKFGDLFAYLMCTRFSFMYPYRFKVLNTEFCIIA